MFFTTTLQIVLVLSGAIYFITGIYILTVTPLTFDKLKNREEFRGRNVVKEIREERKRENVNRSKK